MAHGAAKTNSPIREGLVAMLGPAIDTLFICTLTALAILITGVWETDLNGVTLTAANVVVFWSPVMSVEVYLQCIARIDRVGQKSKMTVVHLQGSPVEKRMYAMLRGKVDQHTKLVDLYREELET